MNKKLTSIAGSTMLAMAVSAANAATYDVSGSWVDQDFSAQSWTPGVGESSGAFTQQIIGADFHIDGQVTTDTNTAGYNITGGTLTMSGYLAIGYGASPTGLLYQNFFGISGTATNNGVVFDSGVFCLSFFQAADSSGCYPAPGDSGYTDVSVANFVWDGTGTYAGGYGTTAGLQLLGGAGGSSFTVAQPGDLIGGPAGNYLTGGTGTVVVGGSNVGAIFLGDSLTFTEVVAPVPVPAAAWLFGSAMLGLVGVARRRG